MGERVAAEYPNGGNEHLLIKVCLWITEVFTLSVALMLEGVIDVGLGSVL